MWIYIYISMHTFTSYSRTPARNAPKDPSIRGSQAGRIVESVSTGASVLG